MRKFLYFYWQLNGYSVNVTWPSPFLCQWFCGFQHHVQIWMEGRTRWVTVAEYKIHVCGCDLIKYRIAGNFWGVLSLVLFGVQFQSRIKIPQNYQPCVPCLSTRIQVTKLKTTKIKFRDPFKDFRKIASPENYQLYGMYLVAGNLCIAYFLHACSLYKNGGSINMLHTYVHVCTCRILKLQF